MAVATGEDACTSSPSLRLVAVGGPPSVAVVLASREADRLVPACPTDAALARSPEMTGFRLAQTASGASSCCYDLLVCRR